MGVETLAVASLVVGGLSAGMQAYGAIQQGQAQKNAANYQAQVARNNQIIAEQNAQTAEQAGVVAEEQQRQKTAALIGGERASMAANGLTLDSGSNLDTQKSTAILGEEDALTIRNNAARTAYGFRSQGVNYGAEANLDAATASNSALAGWINGVGSIAGGASSVSSKWVQFSQSGAFGSNAPASYGPYQQ